jgi:hypothetical protein
MADYDRQRFVPPAPVAMVSIYTIDRTRSVLEVAMLIDSGADVTLIPRKCAEKLGLDGEIESGFSLQGFSGATITARIVEAELVFLGRKFRGRFPLVDEECGILGRNVLNNLSLLLDGPSLNWREEHAVGQTSSRSPIS